MFLFPQHSRLYIGFTQIYLYTKWSITEPLNNYNCHALMVDHRSSILLHVQSRVDNRNHGRRSSSPRPEGRQPRTPSNNHDSRLRIMWLQDYTTTGGRGYQSLKNPRKQGASRLVRWPGISAGPLPTAAAVDATGKATTTPRRYTAP